MQTFFTSSICSLSRSDSYFKELAPCPVDPIFLQEGFALELVEFFDFLVAKPNGFYFGAGTTLPTADAIGMAWRLFRAQKVEPVPFRVRCAEKKQIWGHP